MTKTIKKGLVACLVALMAVLVGVTASAWGGVHAEPEDPVEDPAVAVNKFVGYINEFDGVTIDENLWNEDQKDLGTKKKSAPELWDIYYQAKILHRQINELKAEDYSDVGLSEAKTKFDTIDKLFSDAYVYVAGILSTLQEIAKNPVVNYESSRIEVDTMGTQLGLTTVVTPVEDVEKVDDKYLPFIKRLTNGYEYFYRADAFLDKIAGIFDEIKKQIDDIYYYDDENHVMATQTDGGKHIVLASEKDTEKHGVVDAVELVDKYTQTNVTIDYNVDESSGADEKVQGSYQVKNVILNIEDISKYVENYADLLAARTKIEEYKTMAKEVVKKIHEVYDMVENGTMYYTLTNLINACDTAYKALNDYVKDTEYKFDPDNEHYAAMDAEGNTNFNDMQALVDATKLEDGTLPEGKTCPAEKKNDHIAKTAGMNDGEGTATNNGALFEMLNYLADMKSRIETTAGYIKDLAEYEDPKYDHNYYAAIQKAKKMIDEVSPNTALDLDITTWDKDLYNMRDKKDKDPEYVATPTAYGTEFEQYAEELAERSYIVDGYGAYEAALDQWAKWEAEIKDVITKLQELVDKYQTLETIEEGETTIKTHPMIRKEYTDVLEAYNQLTPEQKAAVDSATRPDEIKDDNAAADRKIKVDTTKFAPAELHETTFLDNGDNNPKDVMDEFARILNAIYKKVDGLIRKIEDLYTSTLDGCVFAERKTLKEIKDEFDLLTAEEKKYVSNSDKLDKMWGEYEEELVIALDWKETAQNLVGIYAGKKVTVNNWTKIKEAVDKFNLLLHKTNGTAEELTDGVLGKLQDAVANDTNEFEKTQDNMGTFKTLYQVYHDIYEDLADEYNKLVKAIEALDQEMTDLDTNGDLDIAELEDWNKKVEDATEHFEALKDNEVTAEWMADEKNGHNEAWENYQAALELYKRYHVEDLINQLYQPDKFEEKSDTKPDGYETNPDVLIEKGYVDLTQECQDKIKAAREAYNEYLEGLGEEAEDEVRNLSKLLAAEAANKEITKELNDWIIRVIKLHYSKYENFGEGIEPENLAKAIDEALDDIMETFEGYPLNIYQDVEGEYNLYDAFDEWWDLIGNGPDMGARADYLGKALGALIQMNYRGNIRHSFIKNNIFVVLNGKIDQIVNKVNAGEELEASDLDLVDEILDTYNKLHLSQQQQFDKDKIKLIEEVADTRDAQEAFANMLQELYNNVVVNGEVTNYSRFYLDTVIALYDTFTASVKETFTVDPGNGQQPLSFDQAVAAIEKAIDEAENVLSLKDIYEKASDSKALEELQAEFERMKDELIQAFNDAFTISLDEEPGSSLKDAITNFKNEIETSIDAKINGLKDELTTQIQGVQDELQGQIDQATNDIADLQSDLSGLESQLSGLESQLGTLQDSLETLQAASASKTELEALQTDLETLQTEFNTLKSYIDSVKANIEEIETIKATAEAAKAAADEAKNTLNGLDGRIETKAAETAATAIADALKANGSIKTELDTLEGKINSLKTELEGKINSLKTELEGKINSLKTELDGKISDLQNKVSELEQKNKDTEDKVNSMSSSITTLTVLIIVIGVLLIAAIVCVVILFLKRKQ